MPRPPDSRVSAGQQIEDELDAISDSMRRQTRAWIQKLRRGQPNTATHSAIIGGIASALLDELWEGGNGDPEDFAAIWAVFASNYIDAVSEDAAAQQEANR